MRTDRETSRWTPPGEEWETLGEERDPLELARWIGDTLAGNGSHVRALATHIEGAEWVISLAAETRAPIVLRVVDAQGAGLPRAELRVVSLDSWRGTRLGADPEDGAIGIALPPGRYRVEAGAPGYGWRARDVALGGAAPLDLGEWRLPLRASFTLELELVAGSNEELPTADAPNELVFELRRELALGESRFASGSFPPADPLALPAGPYHLLIGDTNGVVSEQRLELVAWGRERCLVRLAR